MNHLLSLGTVLALLWLALSGYLAPLMLGLGALSLAFVLWISHRMDVIDRESHPLHMSLGLIRFWALLLRDIVVANVQVVREVLRPRLALTPRVVVVPCRQQTDLGKVILGNSITLTPGTVTLDINAENLIVHALMEAGAQDIEAGTMNARVPADVEKTQ